METLTVNTHITQLQYSVRIQQKSSINVSENHSHMAIQASLLLLVVNLLT
jgi:hypothetical protein